MIVMRGWSRGYWMLMKLPGRRSRGRQGLLCRRKRRLCRISRRALPWVRWWSRKPMPGGSGWAGRPARSGRWPIHRAAQMHHIPAMLTYKRKKKKKGLICTWKSFPFSKTCSRKLMRSMFNISITTPFDHPSIFQIITTLKLNEIHRQWK